MSQQASSPTASEQDTASLRYAAFIDRITAVGGPRFLQKFAALGNFLNLNGYAQHGITGHLSRPIITIATFKPNTTKLDFRTVETHELGSIIDDKIFQLFLVENIIPELMRRLGGHLEIDPQFFLDYIDAVHGGFDITKEEEVARPDIVPTPWYRLQSVEGHLPMLQSLRAECEHIRMLFVGPRECKKANNRSAEERMRPNLQKMNVERIAGLQIAIARNTGFGGRQFDNVAMTRQCASVWFRKPADPEKPEWLKGKLGLSTGVNGPGLWSMSAEGCQNLSQTCAIESAAYVLHTTAVCNQESIEKLKTQEGIVCRQPGGGHSCIIGPYGRRLTEPLGDGTGVTEGTVYADLDLGRTVATRGFLDIVGHYSRPDLLWLSVDKRQREVVVATGPPEALSQTTEPPVDA